MFEAINPVIREAALDNGRPRYFAVSGAVSGSSVNLQQNRLAGTDRNLQPAPSD